MIRLAVWLTFPDGSLVPAAETICDTRPGGCRYVPGFLQDHRTFALDPVSLPLASGNTLIDRVDGVAAVLEDALPDAWGRRLLVRRAQLPRARQNRAHLLQALGGGGIGALGFSPQGEPPPHDPLPRLPELAVLLAAADKFEAGDPLEDEELLLLLNAGSSAGGARPKALLLDGEHPVIAKFPSRGDRLPVVRLEAATMSLARKAGIVTPDTRVERCGGRDVLLVRRFDVTPAGGRRHMISFQTLLRAEGWENAGYEDLLSMLRKQSSQPEVDVPALFRQAVFNAVIGNTDDHLKNFTLLHDDRGYYLSPAYDLLPSVVGEVEHVLHFSHAHVCPGRANLIALGRRAGVPSPAGIIDQVLEAAELFMEELSAFGIAEEDAHRFAALTARQVDLCR